MELAEERPKTPKPPRPGHLLAAALEISIVVTLTVNHSIVGLLLCAGYAWFSATWALFNLPPSDG